MLRETERASTVSIDGQKLSVKAGRQIVLVKCGAEWTGETSDTSLRKKHGLQGPIDDAFLSAFLVARPTGTPWNRAASEQSIRMLQAVLFGDSGSKLWIGKLNGKLPLTWTKDTVSFGAKSFPAAESLPALIQPNPLSPSKYVVVQGGLTAEWHDWAGDHLMSQLGDFAVLEVEEGSEDPDVALDGLFNESWKLQ